MPVNRFFKDSVLNKGTTTLEGGEFRHLATALRGSIGDKVEIFNGKGELAEATVTRLDKQQATLSISQTRYEKPPSPLKLLQALPRMNRIDGIIEKCTELGITEIFLFAGELSERKMLTDHQLNRLQQLTIAACKQSGRLWLPELKWIDPIEKWGEPLTQTVFGDPSSSACRLLEVSEVMQVCIGPESGLSENEKKQLSSLGATAALWNDAVLRTDTAAISAVAIIQATRNL